MTTTVTVPRKRTYWRFAPLAGALLFAVSLPVRSPWLSILASGVIVLPFIQPFRTQLTLRRALPAYTVVGATVPTTYVVTNAGRMATPPSLVTETVPGFAPASLALPPLRPGESAALELPLVATRRSWSLASWPVDVRQNGWFAGSVGPLQQQMTGAPVVRPRQLPWPGGLPVLARAAHGSPTKYAGDGTDVHSVRAWQPGDPPRNVHWRSTARVGAPMVLDRAAEEEREVVLIVADTGIGPAWEDAVSRAAWVCWTAAVNGLPVRLLVGSGARPLPADPSPDDLQNWFAGLDRAGAVDVGGLADELRRTAATGAVAVLTTNAGLLAGLAAASPRVRVTSALTGLGAAGLGATGLGAAG
jgi:uncharacterized protein (DUF58 family)